MTDVQRRSVDSLLAPFAGPDVPGASILVARDGQPLLRRAVGLADVEGRVAATPATNYRLASVTKQFTAMSILLLVQDGKLGLDQPITRYLDLPAWARPITIRHLLTHTSGIWDYEDFVPDSQTYQVKDGDVPALLARAESLYFSPGARFKYSNSGYALLSRIVTRASGTDFATFLRDRIFKPLGMNQTLAHQEGVDVVATRAYGHSVSPAGAKRTDQSNTSAVLGDGGVYSSIDDLAKWDAALWNGRLISPSLWEEATSPVVLTNGLRAGYGFGWFVGMFSGQRVFSHTGTTIGFRNAIYRFPDRRLTVIVLVNRSEADAAKIAERLADLYLP